MKNKTRNLFLASMVGLTASSNGAISFTEDFSSNTAGPNMALGIGLVGASTTFAAGNFHINSGTGSRIYLGSIDTNYSTVDFSFEADVTYSQNNPWGIAFLGMGSSNANTLGQSGEPTGVGGSGPVIAMTLRTDDTGGLGNVTGRDNGATTIAPAPAINNMTIGLPSTHGMRMEWDASDKVATFRFDLNNDQTYESTRVFTLDGSNNSFDGTNSRLFVGGGNGLKFDNIVVTAVPEPSAALLGGLGVLALLRRRRN